ncbi:hypothetical protein D3870_16830 [Noviherbaspirillum cavernae]|uniref:Uncharacterized protein n=1 Tax=Noviherbaspirillum cavernae TaxID=2320862 RepID=A0A418X4V0_9BURK|nr:hypothetical protein D3870_16830 [Noviherbaspirillum cavernae]
MSRELSTPPLAERVKNADALADDCVDQLSVVRNFLFGEDPGPDDLFCHEPEILKEMMPELATELADRLAASLQKVDELSRTFGVEIDASMRTQRNVLEPVNTLGGQSADVAGALFVLRNATAWARKPEPEATAASACHVDHTENFVPTLGRDEIDDMVLHASFAQTVYQDAPEENLQKVGPHLLRTAPESWKSMDLPDAVMGRLQAAFPNLKRLEDGRLLDGKTGFVAQVFNNEKTKEVTIAFGGTFSGYHKTGPISRSVLNLPLSHHQWLANISSATGKLLNEGMTAPDSYRQAAMLAELVKQHASTERTGWKISLTGHSKGGAEAAYAALKSRLRAICFSAPQLGQGILEELGEQGRAFGKHHIRHYAVEGDLIPGLVGSYVSPPLRQDSSHVGSSYWMKAAPEVSNTLTSRIVGREPRNVLGLDLAQGANAGPDALWSHVLFFDSVLHEAGKAEVFCVE